MAIVKKTLQNLKPGKQYLLTVRAKDADLNNTLDPSAAIRFTVPTDQVQPTSLGNLQISVGYQKAMIRFNPADDLNLKNYEYKVYKQSQITQVGLHYEPISENDCEINGFSTANVITVQLADTAALTESASENPLTGIITNSITQNKPFYYVKVRSITTSGVTSSWTPIVKSGEVPFIESAHIESLSASQITSGYIGSETIVLTGSESVIKSSSYKPEKANLIAILVAGTKNVTLTQGTTVNMYSGMYFFIPGLSTSPPSPSGPGRFGSASQIDTITGSQTFTTTVNHSVSGSINFTAYAKGWNITGDGRVNFGGIQGITFDGTTVRIGADAIIDPGASLPEANLFSVVSGAQSLVIGNSGGFIGLRISNTGTGNINNNYWYVDGSFKVGNATKNISYDATSGLMNIAGDVTIGSTGVPASLVVGGAAAGDTAAQPGNVKDNIGGTGITTITGGKVRTGAIESTNLSWNNSDMYSAAGTKIDLDGGQIISKSFRIDSSGNANFKGSITTGSTITGSIIYGGRIEAGVAGQMAYLGDLGNIGGGHYGLALNDFTNIFLKRSSDGAVFFRVDTGSNQYIKFENGTLYIRAAGIDLGVDPNTGIPYATFTGVLSGATGYVTGDFRVKDRLRVGDGANVSGTTILRVQADGNTATNKYPFVVEKLNGDNTFTVREDGRVDVLLGSLYVGGTIVSLSGHSHSYLPLSGGTLTGNLVSQGTTYTRELNITAGYNINASSINITAGYDINASGTGSVITGATVNGTNMQAGYMTLTGGWGVKSDWSPNADNAYDLGQDNTPFGSTSATTTADKRWKRLYSNNTSISISDIRLKKDIEDASLGLDFIEALRPVSYKFIVGSNEVEKDQNGNPIIIGTDEKGGEIHKLKPIPGVRRHWGFIAQEVKQVIDQSGVEDFAGWSMSNINDPDSKQSLSYEQFISPLVKAVQELSQKVKELELKI